MSKANISAVDKLWQTRCPVPTATSVALQEVWFQEEFDRDGISIASLRESSDPIMWESHFDHNVRNSFREGGNIPPIWARSKGTDVRVVGMHWSDHIQAIISGPDTDIRTVEELAGRRFGLPRRTNDKIDFWAAIGIRTLETALQHAGMSLNDVDVVPLEVSTKFLTGIGQSKTDNLWSTASRYASQRAEYIALATGKVDATFSTSFRALEMLNILGANLVCDIGRYPEQASRVTNMNPTLITVNGELCDKHPDIVARYLSVAIRAGEWAKANREEVVRCVAREVVAPELLVEHGFAPDFHQQLVPSLADEMVDALESQKEFLLKHGFISTDINIDTFIEKGPLTAAQAMATL